MKDHSGLYSVNLWGSDPDHQNDDCHTGECFPFMEAAQGVYDDPSSYFRDADVKEAVFVELDGPFVYMKRRLISISDEQKCIYKREREEKAERREYATQQGMGLGINAYNEAMNQPLDPGDFDDRDMAWLYQGEEAR